MKKTLFFTVLLLSIYLVACGANEDSPSELAQEPQITQQNVEESTDSGGYPDPGYPAQDRGEDFGNVNDRPETLPTFPGSLAFSSTRLGSSSIFVLKGSTGVLSRVPSNNVAYEPSWSPDCQQIAMTGEVGVNQFQIFKAGATESSDAAQSISSVGFGPAWSPDGRVIAFQKNENLQVNICFADSDSGAELGCLDENGFTNAMPAWSPDGTQLTFASNRSGSFDIFVADYPNYEAPTQLTNDDNRNFDPEFSPDGSMIAFASRRSGVYDIVTVTLDGQNETRITNEGTDSKAPAWVGNNHIAFVNDLSGNEELFLVDLENKNLQQLTFNLALDIDPVWCATE